MLESIKIQRDHILKDIHQITVVTDTTTVTTGIREDDAKELLDCAFELKHKDGEALKMLVEIYLKDGFDPHEIQTVIINTIKDHENQ